MESWNWFSEHWFTFLQSIAIVAGLVFTAVSLRLDARVRRISNLLTANSHHRDIWSELYRRPELGRVLDPKADVSTAPPTSGERMFVTLLIHHLAAFHQASRARFYRPPEGLSQDIAWFFSLPIPQAVWNVLKPYQDRRFIRFVERLRCTCATSNESGA